MADCMPEGDKTSGLYPGMQSARFIPHVELVFSHRYSQVYNLPVQFDLFQQLVTAQENLRDMIMDAYLESHEAAPTMARFYPLPKVLLHDGEHCINCIPASITVSKAHIPTEDAVKNIAFQLKGQFTENLFVVIGSVFENKPLLTVTMSEDQVKAGLNAGQLVREAAKLIQGGGGGQPHFATAGGKNPDGLNAAVDKVVELAGF